jgi:hypothetical protein
VIRFPAGVSRTPFRRSSGTPAGVLSGADAGWMTAPVPISTFIQLYWKAGSTTNCWTRRGVRSTTGGGVNEPVHLRLISQRLDTSTGGTSQSFHVDDQTTSS